MGRSSRSKSPTRSRSKSRSASREKSQQKAASIPDTRNANDDAAMTEPPSVTPKKQEQQQEEEQDPEPPQPVSSDEETNWVAGTPTTKTATTTASSTNGGGEMSRLFAPYRTVGVVTSGRPFHLIPNQNSTSAMLCLPIGERFQILSCERLQPILVSQKVPGQKVPQHIGHLVSDATLSISLVTHGAQHCPQHVTLYQRTLPLQTLKLATNKSWKIFDLMHLGRIKQEMKAEKLGKKENVAIVAAILSSTNSSRDDDDEEEHDNIPVVGDSDDDEDSSSSGSDSSSEEDSTSKCQCQVVVLLATRDSMRIHKRIALTTVPTFTPIVALHPSTYVNKIILGGSVSQNATKEAALLLLNIRSGKIIHQFACLCKKKKKQQHPSTSITALAQSPAVDTVAVGTSSGRVHLVNLRHDKTLFSLNHKARDGSDKPVRITSLSFRTDGSAQNYGIAPMAVGRDDGSITVWDLNPPDSEDDDDNDKKKNSNKKARTILTELLQVHAGGVSQLVYLPQEPLLVSIGKRSNAVLMHIFDNPDHSGRILRQRKGHTSPPTRIRYLHPGASAGGGIMVNMGDGTDASACQILSAGGLDRTLRIFSTARSVLDKEYSQGKGLEKKARKLGMDSTADLLLPPVTAMASCEARSRDWGDLVTIHRDHAMAYVWSNKRGAQWGPVLRQPKWNVSAMKAPPPPTTHASSVAMSACGNFAVVGTRGGIIYKYNVQSGNTRGSYPLDASTDDDQDGYQRKILQAGDVKRTMKALEKKMKISNRASNLDRRDEDAVQEALAEQRRLAKLKQACHTGSMVTGIAVDSTNKTMISVGADAKLILWNFSTHAPHKKSPYKLPSPAAMLCHVRDSDLAAIALEDYTAILFDCTTLSIVRRFGAGGARHSGPISDLAFSPDGRTLYSASLDGTVRVFDVPTNTCVDWLGFETPPTSLTVSPTGEFLATTHIGKLGLSIWSDRSFYQTVNVNGAKELEEPFRMDQPRPLAEVWEKSQDEMPSSLLQFNQSASEDKESDATGTYEDSKLPAVAKESGLVTLSNLPPAHWKNLFHLELIKERNKPKEPPKKPPSAPFFLQWRGGESTGDTPGPENADEAPISAAQNDEDEWKAAWSDDDDDEDGDGEIDATMTDANSSIEEKAEGSMVKNSSSSGKKRDLEPLSGSRILKSDHTDKKRKTIRHHRSRLATLLYECSERPSAGDGRRFQVVMDHIATLGPSAIDVSLSSLCNGSHDLEEGLPLLRLACLWLIEGCESRERYEAVNAYLHRFLYLHATVIAGIEDESWNTGEKKEKALSPEEQEELDKREEERRELVESLSKLRKAQQSALNALNGKLQSSLCLLRHFSRMV